MLQLNHPLFKFLVFSLFATLFAVLFALRAHAADIPAYDGGSQTPGSNAPGSEKEIPLDRPSIEITALSPWVTETIGEAMTLDPDTYEKTLKKVADKFTRDGWKSFTSTLARDNIIDQVKDRGMTTSLTTGNPILLSEGVEEGKYQWLFTMSATITYVKNKDEHSELTTINVKVVRVPLKDNLLGIQISDWSKT